MKATSWNELEGLIEFLDKSPTAWHAVAEVKSALNQAGFQELKESDRWNLHPEGCYYAVRNGASLCAFVLPAGRPESARILASHTDSPALKIKPNAEYRKENMVMFGVEVYGGPLLTSWLNRDLGIAGRIVFTGKGGKMGEALIRIDSHPLVIPQLAIHLDRNVNENGLVLNKQEHLAALACLEKVKPSEAGYLEKLLREQTDFEELLGFDLFLYPLEPAKYLGYGKQMIAGYRLDSLSSVHAATAALINAKKASTAAIKAAVFWNHEEVGSSSSHGAGSPFLPQVLERILLAVGASREDYFRLISRSACVSVDLGHALHPNYAEKHEPRHQIFLNKGIVLKSNAQQRYATDASSSAMVVEACRKLQLPLQKFVVRGDIPCGSTIGPVNANLTGISTVDIGIPQLSMHSCREIVGCGDHLDLCRLLEAMLKA